MICGSVLSESSSAGAGGAGVAGTGVSATAVVSGVWCSEFSGVSSEAFFFRRWRASCLGAGMVVSRGLLRVCVRAARGVDRRAGR